ncbi:MAG TPA: class I SAM-dependent methyltransferase [Chiayiivirga sp.]|nr:class I SAM-dependent methyltransferase [Chiayiivirga sp.]
MSGELPSDDEAIEALNWWAETHAPPLTAGSALFLNARACPRLLLRDDLVWHCEQPYRPWTTALQRRGIDARSHIDATGFTVSLILIPPQRDEARALMARAVAATQVGGWVIAVAPKRAGGGTLEAELGQLLGGVQTLTKHRCRIVWGQVDPAHVNVELQSQWRELDAPRCLETDGETFWTRPGLFAWDRIDPASALLAAHLPANLAGRAADLGAGWGYLSMQLLRRCPAIEAVHLFEANARAEVPSRRNLDAVLATRADAHAPWHWHDVTQGLPERFDVIVSNPPFHIGAREQVDLGRAFIRSARSALSASGEFWLVANRHLPYEAKLAEHFRQVDTMIQHEGFKVICARGPRS